MSVCDRRSRGEPGRDRCQLAGKLTAPPKSGSLQGTIVADPWVELHAQVAVWSVSPEGELTSSASWSGAFIAYTLARGPSPLTLIVGDALRSVTLLSYVPPSTAPMQAQLKELGKDYRARYMVAVEALSTAPDRADDGLERIVGAEADLNLFTLERDAHAGARSMADAGVLSAQGRWHVGEVISRFRRGELLQSHRGTHSGATCPGVPSSCLQRF